MTDYDALEKRLRDAMRSTDSLAEDALAAVRDLRAERDGFTLIPNSALAWLNGEGDDFECPPDLYFRGKEPRYWWRSEFKRRIAAQEKA